MLKTRIFTALAGVPLLIFFTYLGGYWYGLIILIIALIGLKEYLSIMIKKEGKTAALSFTYLLLPLSFLAVFKENTLVTLVLWTFIFAFFCLLPVFFNTKISYQESVLSFWGILYTGGLASFLLAIRLLPKGFILTIFLFLMVWGVDTLAYFIGSIWGKTPLAPQISPKKTVEGTIAGITGSSVIGMLFPYLFLAGQPSLTIGFLLGLLVGITATLGDLSQSALKRSAGAKDSGRLLPGHGGILDRFDSLFFAAPFFYFYIRYVLAGI